MPHRHRPDGVSGLRSSRAVSDAGSGAHLLQAVVAQLIGYDLAQLRGHDPDMPRNLAKSVTVK